MHLQQTIVLNGYIGQLRYDINKKNKMLFNDLLFLNCYYQIFII